MTRRLAARLLPTLAVLALLPLALWGQFQTSRRILTPLTVDGVAVPDDPRAARRALSLHADAWSAAELEVVVGEARRTYTRGELGAALSVEPMLAQAAALGRSHNPLVDGAKWWAARRGRLTLRWVPQVDRAQLAALVEREQRRVEVLPVAGVTDGQGFSLPGRDGVALDPSTALRLLERALVAHDARVTLPLQSVAAPPPIAIGSPDGALFAGTESPSSEPEPVLPVRPNASDDCFDEPPQRPFCDGPRRVPTATGAARALAESLGLGTLSTIARLIRQGPTDAWVRAAGASGGRSALSWPVPQGKLGRGFGYVRTAALRDRIHAGVDIVAPQGSDIVAVAPGLVAYSDNRVRGYGNLLAIVHDDGAVTLSAHCSQILVAAGERVARGQRVAQVGMTGLAMGPHLHFEYHEGGRAADPAPLFVR